MSLPNMDSRERPMSEVPTSTSPALKTFGQDYRYAETLQNPFPEVVFSGPENTAYNTTPTSPAAVGGGDGATESATNVHDARSSLRPDTVGSNKEPVMHEDIWVEPAEAPWHKTISRRKWATIIICTVGITGVVLAILGAMDKLSGGKRSAVPARDSPDSKQDSSADLTSASDSSGPADSSPSTTGTLSTTSTTTSTNPSSTNASPNPAINCSSPATFLSPITWIGTDVGGYKGEFAQASSAKSCCKSCLGHAAGGCAGWLYNSTSAFTPCTKIIVSADEPGKDDQCPKGHASTTYFAKGEDGDESGGVAGMGPCGGRMQVQ